MKIYYLSFKNIPDITIEEISEFTFNMLNNISNFEVNKKIKDYILDPVRFPEEPDSTDHKFFHNNSEKLSSFMVKLHAASLINLHLIITGPTGIGKTSSARSYSRIRGKILNLTSDYFYMHPFHFGTKPNNFYGSTILKNEHIVFINGPLTKALKKGLTFIADEMNLSSIYTMKSLAPALEINNDQTIYIPGLNEKISIKSNFFFIACQNDLGTIGRNPVPNIILKRFKELKYPGQDSNEVQKLCIDIKNSLYSKDEKKSISDEDAKLLGQFMVEYNNVINNKILTPLSLRDIFKIFKRIVFQKKMSKDYLNIKIYHNILFYILSSLSKEDLSNVIDLVINKIKSVFSGIMKKDENLKNIFLSEPKLEILENREMICKGECGISINVFNKHQQDKNKIFEEIMSLPSLYNAFFKVLLSNEDEPILLTGPSGFKSFLAKKILSQDDIISLNQESSIEQLLGSPLFLTNIEAKKFYIYYICLICQSNNYLDYIKELEKNENIVTDDLKNKINEEIKKKNNCKIIPKTFKVSLDNLTKKLYSNKTYSERGVLLDMKLEFKPGLFLSAILGGKSLILKNLSNLPTEVLERFNELFSDQHSLTIPEDIYNTFTSKNKKELSNFVNKFHKFRVIATCPTGYSSKLSEAALSRFTVIAVDEYSEKEQKFILKENFIKNQDINDNFLQHIITFISRFNNKFHKHFSLMQIINMVKIISYIKSQDNKYNNKE